MKPLTPRNKRLLLYISIVVFFLVTLMVMTDRSEKAGFMIGYAKGVDDAMAVLPFIEQENRENGGAMMSIRELAAETRYRLNE